MPRQGYMLLTEMTATMTGKWEPFVLSTPPAEVDIPGGDLDDVRHPMTPFDFSGR